MIKVNITDSSGREREIEIGEEPQVLGRGEDSDVVLGSRSISRHHMKLWEDSGKLFVEDLTGGTGITVDGEEVSGTFELEPGADLEAGVFIFNIPGARLDTALDGEEMGEAVPVPMLIGAKGPTKGLEIELQEGENDIGRDPSLYLVIDDPSVSRLHARLTVQAGAFHLVDLRSSNGTFVNGQRIDQADLRSGDLVRFGNLEFLFRYGEEISEAASQRKRKKMLILLGGAAGLLLLVGLAVGLGGGGNQPRPGQHANRDRGPDVAVLVEQHLRTAKAFMEEAEWKKATRELDTALDLHPICRECRQLKSRVEEEVANESLYDKCVVDYDLNDWRKALACFRQIPEDSIYAKKSKYKISECISRLKKYHLGEGKGYYNARRYREAHGHFVSYMKLDPCDQKVFNKWLKKAEKRLPRRYRRRKGYEWRCETEHASDGIGSDPLEILKNEYPDRKLFKVVELYFRGKIDSGIHELRKIVALERDQGRVEKARALMRDLRVIKGKYNDGLSRLLQGKLDEARDRFDQAMVVDRKIMPKGVTSQYREDIGRQLTGKLHKEALSEFSRDRFLSAFQLWTECLQRNPAAKVCQQGMSMLNNKGEEALSYARRFEAQGNMHRVREILNHVLEITPEESMSHKKAQIWLNKLE